MLFLFDWDGTLISGYMDRPDRDYTQWEVLPGRQAMLAALISLGHQLGVVTNQAGVAFGHVTEADFWHKYNLFLLDMKQPIERLPVRVCFSHEQGQSPYNKPADVARRKPSAAMLQELVATYPAQAAQGIAFIGDRPEDLTAADRMGCSFTWAQSFFPVHP